MTELEKEYLLFTLDEDLEEFKEIKDRTDPLSENFNSNSIYVIVDSENKTIWIWHGSNTNIRMKFIATHNAPLIRDKYGIDYKIAGIDEGNEPLDFKNSVGLD